VQEVFLPNKRTSHELVAEMTKTAKEAL